MKLLYKILILLLFLQPLILFSNTSKIESDPVIFICNELLGRPTDNSITIHASANKTLEVYYEYGADSLNYSAQTTVAICPDSIPFVFVIEKLEPNTKYFYRMRYREVVTQEYFTHASHSFHTQRKTGETFKFAIEADPHLDTNSNPASYALTLQNILAANPDFLMDLGDTFMSEKLPQKKQTEITNRHLLLRSYFDIICHSVPLFLIIGNHEGEVGWELDGTANNLAVMASNTRKLYYPNPEPNSFYRGNTKSENFVGLRQNYYSFEWGNALFVVLDPYWYTTNKTGWGWTLGLEQYNWFKSTLESSKSKFKFVFCHNLVGGTEKDARGGIEEADYYEWGGKDSNNTYSFDKKRPGWGKPIHQLMVDNKVSIFFHGHDHFYGKQEKDGIIYQECPQPSNRNIQNTQATNYGYLNGTILPGRGYLLLTITDSTAKVDYVKTFVPTEEKGGSHNGDIGHTYTLKISGTTEIIENQNIPEEFRLVQNYPNPFAQRTQINYTLKNPNNVQLKVFDENGQDVTTLVNKFQQAGTFSVSFDAEKFSLPCGTYYYSITIGNSTLTKKMVLIN